MNIDDIKEYIVILNGGSGCIVQPETNDYTYVLTAKHVFDEINDPPYNGRFTVTRFQRYEGGWKEVPQIVSTLTEDNYFPHPTKDIAILKVPKIPGLEKLVRTDNIVGEKDRRGYTLTGFPQARRTGKSSNWYRNNEDTVIKEMRDNGLREAQVQGNPDVEEVRGQSGGGIVKIAGDFILLAGIQNKMVDGEEQLGSIEFSPLLNFDEIIAAHPEKLLPITPKANNSKKVKLPKRFDEIYVCDREVFKANFDLMYAQHKSGIQNYIIVGPAPHSPPGSVTKNHL